MPTLKLVENTIKIYSNHRLTGRITNIKLSHTACDIIPGTKLLNFEYMMLQCTPKTKAASKSKGLNAHICTNTYKKIAIPVPSFTPYLSRNLS